MEKGERRKERQKTQYGDEDGQRKSTETFIKYPGGEVEVRKKGRNRAGQGWELG